MWTTDISHNHVNLDKHKTLFLLLLQLLPMRRQMAMT
jgi:hypothetical protein